MKKLCTIFLLNLVYLITFSQVTNAGNIADRISLLPDMQLNSSENKELMKPWLFEDRYYLIASFATLPAKSSAQMTAYNYLGATFYWVSIDPTLSKEEIQSMGITALYTANKNLKASADIINASYPAHCLNETGFIDISILLFKASSKANVLAMLSPFNIKMLDTKAENATYYPIRVPLTMLDSIIALPFIHFVEPILPAASIDNYENNATHGPFYLKSNGLGGRALSGKGVTVGEGDDGNITSHIDYVDRVIDRASYTPLNHSTHVGGTIAGAGILNPQHEGMAPKVTIIGEYFTNIIGATDQHVRDFNMVYTNNSYHSAATNCTGNGVYTSASNFADAQQKNNDTLLHVFAAGNDGGFTCAPYPAGFHTVKSSWQMAKNTLVVANMQESYAIAGSSSRGPSDDGRLVPEITAVGTNVLSCNINNTYNALTGTSMASPTTTGTLALLCERFRQTHAGRSPLGGLMKAIACNTATDWGNSGPDYTFGYGILNAVRAVRCIENDQFIINSVSHSITNNHTITVPAGAQQLKVMLYWVDEAGDPAILRTLVNDLNLSVTSPTATTTLPWVLNQTPASVNNLALRGRDSLNNIEQVTIDNPAAGTYTLNVQGFNVPSATQRYFICYDIVQPSVEVLWPNGADPIRANTTVNVIWDAFGGDPNTFSIEYSLNNGSTWTVINAAAASTSRRQAWTVPNTSSTQALVRVIRNVAGFADTSNSTFVILAQPTLSSTIPCEGYVRLTWLPIAGSTSYDVLMKVGDSFQVINNGTDTFFMIGGLSNTTAYYFTVRPKIGANNGMRAVAVAVTPSTGTCSLSNFDNDLKLVSINNATGRINTSSALSSTQIISITIKNLDNIATSGSYNLSYSINGGSPVTQSLSTVINSLATLNHSFSSTANLAAVGSYSIKAWVSRAGDVQAANDTVVLVIRQLSNPVVVLPALENFETLSNTSYGANTIGLTGDDGLDFFANTGTRNRARTYVSNAMCNSGSRAISMDARSFNGTTNTIDYLFYTVNMSSYNTTQNINMDFYYMHHGNLTGANDRVWIRGNDAAAWIQAYDLFANQTTAGVYKLASGINISALLAANGQSYSSSFQVRFGWQGTSAVDNLTYTDGYTFDDINIYQIVDDISAVSVNSPPVFNCALSNSSIIQASIRNNVSATITNIPVAYSIDGGAYVNDVIPSIAGNTTLNFSFSTPANLSAFGLHTVSIIANYGTDSYRLNDTIKNYVYMNNPNVSSFPYLEEFETNDGNYVAAGTSTWQWGTPTKTIINKAANGSKAWVTRLSGNYADNSSAVLYSPCFNLTSLTSPVLSFSHIYQTENGWDFMWVEYSTNNGSTWTKLGAVGSGTNWYNDGTNTWDNITDTKWHVATCPIPTAAASMRFRFVFTADNSINFEGVGIDDIHIFDRALIYTGASNPAISSQTVNGSNWIHFNSGSQRVMSINSNGQNLGSTSCNVYINSAGIRNNTVQYYLDRNLVIKPSTAPTAPVNVRYYFSYAEAQALINATGCALCTSIADAYESGVTKFHATNPVNENGTLADNALAGIYSYLLPNAVKIIPYDNGYYAEFAVSSFSEFWINDGGVSANLPLPVEWLSFDVTKQGQDGLVEWATASEINCDYFEVQVSLNPEDGFASIAKLAGQGNTSRVSSYSFLDKESKASGFRYYRIKQVDLDGQFDYSAIKALYFESNASIQVSPNPFSSELQIETHGLAAALSRYEICNLQGQIVKSGSFAKEGEKIEHLDVLSKGNYILKLYANSQLLKTYSISKIE